MRAAIVILTFNRWALTRLCLSSIFQNTLFPHDLIVIDNGSWDGTVEKLKFLKKEEKIDKLILLPKNVGISRGANYGFKAASTKNPHWFARVDNDILVCPYWLAYTCYVSTLPGLGVIGVNVQGYNVTKFKVVNGVQLDNCPNPGGIYVFTRETFKKLGYFQEGSMYGIEDVEFHARQKQYGLRSVYVHGIGKPHNKCRELADLPFNVNKNETYREWKTRQHNQVMLPKWADGRYPILKHYETNITVEEIEKYTWESQ